MAKLQITLTRSVIGRPETQRKTVEAVVLQLVTVKQVAVVKKVKKHVQVVK